MLYLDHTHWKLFSFVNTRVRQFRDVSNRGDVAEKIVIVGIFVVLAIAVGLLITHAVTTDATKISNQISGAP